MAMYPEFTDWLTRLLRVYYRVQTAVAEQDDGRDVQYVIDMYKHGDALTRKLIDTIFVAFTGWQFSTVVTGMADDGRIPDGFEKIRYFGEKPAGRWVTAFLWLIALLIGVAILRVDRLRDYACS